MSGYPYGGPPSTQPYGGGGYGTPPAGYVIPYGVGAPPAAGEKPSKSHKVGDYHPSVPPSSAPYAAASSQYSGVKPSKTGYQPSASPAAGPYGGYVDPYSAGSEKPSKAQQGGGYGDPYSEKPSNPQQEAIMIKLLSDPQEQRSKARQQQHLDFKHQQDQLRRRHANYPALNGAMVPLSSNGRAAKIQEVQETCG